MNKHWIILILVPLACILNAAEIGAEENSRTLNPASGYYSEFSHAGFYLKDYFVYRSPIDQMYHLYYNIGKADAQQSWRQPFNEKQFGHATSKDLQVWKIHDTILPVVPVPFSGRRMETSSAFGNSNGKARVHS